LYFWLLLSKANNHFKMIKSTTRFSVVLAALLSFCYFQALGQDFNNYKSIKSSGNVPEKFLTSSTAKYQQEVEKLSKKEQNRLRRAKKQFFLESSFVIDDMLLSGKVLFNDPVSNYVNRVVDEILKNDKELRGKLEVYVIKTYQVNAFTTNNGIIFVTLGLVAQLENEAELAFILCHEITHYVKQHNLNEFVENTDISAGRGRYNGTNLDEKLLARSNYSKKQESEADMLGLERFLKTDYDPSTLNGVFNVLEFAHLPFDELPFNKSFLETQNLKIPAAYFLKKTKEIEASGDDDSLQTHPAVKLRREAVMDKLKNVDTKGKKKYIVGEKDFLTAQKISRFEMCSLFLHYREYESAFYNAYLLIQDDSNSAFLKKCIGKSLYGLSKYANAGRFSEAHDDYSEIQGSSQQVNYMFSRFKYSELNVIAVEYLYTLKKQYPKDKEIAALTEDIFEELPNYFDDRTFFSTTPRPANLDSLIAADTLVKEPVNDKDTVNEDDQETHHKIKVVRKKNKYEKITSTIKKKEDKKSDDDKRYFIKYAFVDLLKDSAFISDYDKSIAGFRKQREEKEYEETSEYKKEHEKRLKKAKNSGIRYGINKLVIVNPFYYKVDELIKNNPVKLVASESAQKEFNFKIKNNASLAGINYQLIDKKDLTAGSADLFNDLSILNAYFTETTKHDEMHYVNYMSDEIQDLTQKYGTKYFNWVGIVCYRDHSGWAGLGTACCAILVPPLFPIALYNSLRPHYNTFIYSAVLDLNNGETVSNKVTKIKFKDRLDIVNSMLYDLYFQYQKK
jgi:beta-barrel assembly-enhancing protease